jgi:predicted site-specific integrase-resolvase
MSAKEYLYGRKRRLTKASDGTFTALYLRVSTADQKPDLQYDGLRAYAKRAGLASSRITAMSGCQAVGKAVLSSTP